jgi:phosphatidylglycerol:prolipoprotein diacylglycerol transferase
MIPYPNIDPDIIRIGPIAVRWYGMMYLIGFVSSYLLVKYQIKKQGQGPRGKGPGARVKGQGSGVTGQEYPSAFLDSLYTYVVLGLMIGARLGYVVFYNLSFYIQHPLDIIAVWQGGLSFHGGLIGSVLAGIWCCRKFEKDPWQVSDLVMATAPIGIGLGRLGNFINGELYGRIADVPWAMVFPNGGPLPRHPSQLYEFLLEGVVLFSLLWTLKDKGFRPGVLTAFFIMIYGLFRIFVEFFREPDQQLGFIAGPFTMGQLLSLSMVIIGAGIFFLRKKRS